MRELAGISEIKQAYVELVKVARDVRGLMLQTDPAKTPPYAEMAERAFAQFEQHFLAYKKTGVSAEDQARVAELERLIPQTRPTEILKLALAGDARGAAQKQGDSRADLVTRSGATLQEIVTSVKRVGDLVAEIAAASREQASGIDQVNRAVAQMDQVVQSNAAQTEELSTTAQSLSGQAEQLQALVARFRLGETPAADRDTGGERPGNECHGPGRARPQSRG
jgi:hypothetical protein